MKLMVGSGVYKCPFKMVFFRGTCSFSKGGGTWGCVWFLLVMILRINLKQTNPSK